MGAAKNSQYEKMTGLPVWRLIIKLSIPAILTMLVNSIYNMADTAFVSSLGNSASGAVGVVFGFMAILQSIGFMFGQGSGNLISRCLGAGNKKTAVRLASTAFFSVLAIGIAMQIFVFIFIRKIVFMLGSTETIAPYAITYIRYILAAAPFMLASFVMNNILRYEGKASIGMIGMMAGAILNIAGDPILMYGFNMGIAGAGLSTALSQIIGFLILLFMFLSGRAETKISPRYVSFKFSDYFEIITTGLPSMLRQGLQSMSTVLLNSCSAVYGDEAVAAMSIVSRVIFFVFSVGLGIGQGFQPVSGFNYGAGLYKRQRKAYRFTLIASEILLTALAAVMLCASPIVIEKFRNDELVIEIGTRALQLQCISLLFQPLGTVTEMQLQTAGCKLSAAILSSLKSGLLFIPLLLILSRVRGLYGIQEAQPIANVLSFFAALFFAVRFFRRLPREDLCPSAERN